MWVYNGVMPELYGLPILDYWHTVATLMVIDTFAGTIMISNKLAGF
jgi:hypothetical protein